MVGGRPDPSVATASGAPVAEPTGVAPPHPPVDVRDGPSAVGPPPGTGRRPVRPGLLVAAVTACLAVPPLISAAVLRTPRWYPTFDLAVIEMSVRDVATAHTPLLGLVGRLGTVAVPGHHPGPLGFYALWPVYALTGQTAWSLRLSSVVLSVLALGVTVWIASRRGGRGLVLGVGAALALLVATYPAVVPVEPWNPHEPVLWWPVVLMGVWSVFDDDLAVLPVTVFAASLCAQTHVSYVGLVGGMAALVSVVLAVRAVRRRSDRAALRRTLLWSGASIVLGLVLWTPPVAQQLFGAHPNLSIIWGDFRHPAQDPLGLRHGVEVLLVNMSPAKLLRGDATTFLGGSRTPGAVLVLAWAVAAAAARTLPDRRIARLHATAAAALVLGVASARTVHGLAYPYLFLWARALAVLVVAAVLWTAAARWASARPGAAGGIARAGAALGVVAMLVFTGVAGSRAATVEPVGTRESEELGGVVGPTVEALERGRAPGRGADGRYLVTWTDTMSVANQGWGLLNELERAGLDVGASPGYAALFPGDRARTPDDATAVVHLSVGPDIRTWRACPGAREIAFHDARTPAEVAESRRLAAGARARLREVGAADLAPRVDDSILRLGLDPRVPPDVGRDLTRIVGLGMPLAVFTGPPDLRCPPPAA